MFIYSVFERSNEFTKDILLFSEAEKRIASWSSLTFCLYYKYINYRIINKVCINSLITNNLNLLFYLKTTFLI